MKYRFDSSDISKTLKSQMFAAGNKTIKNRAIKKMRNVGCAPLKEPLKSLWRVSTNSKRGNERRERKSQNKKERG